MSEYDDLLPDEKTQSKPEPPSTNVEAVEQTAIIVRDEEHITEELPPAPGEPGDLAVAPLAVREAAKLARMTPEQRERYDAAQAEIMSHPAVASFAEEEERRFQAKKVTQEAFLAAYRKKQKEKT